ncbi:hypothetical protein AWB67_06712 [Caballeronia terrestris]|uniref:Uncharacterized protein n=1 Tax=Caballeronia terrestris TaxID=1226301 RepID=A0A158KV12_9BURK|nr:hypothetical protein AWB67_06712 [Caballeronia terrestris]
MSRTSPIPSKFSAMMRPPSNFIALTAPASSARSLRSSAIANACSLNGAVTFIPLPPLAMKARTVSANAPCGSNGPSIAVYDKSCRVSSAKRP